MNDTARTPAADDSIPVLTEVVSLEPGDDDLRAGLERRIVAQVLERLTGSPELLGEPVQQVLRAATDRFAASLALDLRASLELALLDILEPAVREAVREAVTACLPGQLNEPIESPLRSNPAQT